MISSRYAVAVHILTLIALSPDTPMSSEDMAGSIGVHPVMVRSALSQLRKAGLVQTRQGVAGTQITRPLQEITLKEVFLAVLEGKTLFSMHDQPNPNCPVGRNIQGSLEWVFTEATRGMLSTLEGLTLSDVVQDMTQRMS
ncbi:Rrf2 family transcriptional regulator [Deinococcus cellulosilyticus]|uniref:Rrf2 family transcriptional regulator n=1 Tax=Deinococcus cellulosilyticus (strain DSM 18568 / NBRC 106333 / KACC 11606 / 5516J-15) TaxID=1223518 RepID=A0A511MY07_DEIC1|nr:Rrf2 family transcriptional regulator [Deinococcus cellulosilyticus]GEM45474.1 Rrf2 family transcriptional regulator [Deinococcus cellulosilyticus NBRC 106333 = KACC 11606]